MSSPEARYTGGDLLAQTLHDAGVTKIFALHGGHHEALFKGCTDQGIDLIEIGFLYPATLGGVCTACSCGRGDQLLVRAKAADVATLEKTYGFKLLASSDGPDGGLGYTPRQCDSNPWAPAAKPMTREEAESAARWLESKGATVARTGLVLRTTAAVVCDACSCPRGDRLVASATNASAAASLRLLSFSELPR